MEFGRIVVLRKYSTGATYELDLGEHSIGSSDDCDLRLKLQNRHILPKHAFVKVSPNGVAIITNKSAHAPVIINGNPCLKFEVLKHGDIFEIMEKQFQYLNENLKDEPENRELFIREKKNVLKLGRKSITPLVKTYTTCKFSGKARARRSFMSARRSSAKSRRNSFAAKCLNADDTVAKDQTIPIDNDSSPIQDNTVHSSASSHTKPNFSRAESDSPSESNISTTISDSLDASEEILHNEERLSKNASILHGGQNNSENGSPIPNDVQLDMSEFDPVSNITVRLPNRHAKDFSDFPIMPPPHKKSVPTRGKSIIIVDEDTSSYEVSDLVLSESFSLKVLTSSDEDALKDSTDSLKMQSTTSVSIFDETTQEANQKHFKSTTPPSFSCPTSDQNAPDIRITTFDESTQNAIQNGNTLEVTEEVPDLNKPTKISDANDFAIEVLSPVKPLKPNGNDRTYVRRSMRSSVLTKTALTTSLKEPTAVPLNSENECDDPQSMFHVNNTNSALEETEIDVVNFTPASEAKGCLQVSSDQNESPLKGSNREPIFTSTPFVKARVTEHSVTTELSKPVKRRSSLRLPMCKGEGPNQPKRVRSLSLPQLPKVENKKLLSRSVFQPTDPKDISSKHEIISKRKPEDPCETTLEMLDVVKDETPKSHIKPVRRLSKANASTYNPVVEDITPVTPGVLQETDCMGDLFKTPTNTPGLFESIRVSAMRSRKRGRESHVVLYPEKNNSTRTINQEQPNPQQTSPKHTLRKRQKKSPLSRLSGFERVKKLVKTPVKSPNNDPTNVPNLRKLMSPRVRRSPKNDLTNVPNLRKLMSPRVRRSPKNDLTNVPNLRKLMSPRVRRSPKNDLTNVPTLRKMMSPRVRRSPKNDLTNVPNLRKMMSPRVRRSPKNDLTNVPNLRKMMSPRVRRSPKNDLTNVPNLRKMMSPRVRHSPKNDLTSVTGIGSLLDTSGVDLLHNDSDEGYSKDLFTRLSGKSPIKSYTYKGKSLSPAKGERKEQNENSRKSMGAIPSCSPRVHQWMEQQMKINAEQSSFGGDGNSAKSPPKLEQTVPLTRSASSKKRASQDYSRRKTNGNKVKSNLSLDFTQPESVDADKSNLLPGSGDMDSTVDAAIPCKNPTSLDVLVHNEIKSAENLFQSDNEKNNSTRSSKKKNRTPLMALVTENVIQTPENTVSKVIARRSTRKSSASGNSIGQMEIVAENDAVKEMPSEKRRSKIATVTTDEAIDISEPSQTGHKLEVQVHVAQELSSTGANSPAFSLRRTTRRRKLLSDDDLYMVIDPNAVEDPNAVKTTKQTVSSIAKSVKTTKKFTRSQLGSPVVEANFYEKSEQICEATPDVTKTKTAKLKTRKGNKNAILQTHTAADDLDTEKIEKTTLKNTETSAGRPTRTRVGARKLRQEREDMKNTILSSSDTNLQIIAEEKDKDTETSQEETKDAQDNLEKPTAVTSTGRKTARSVEAKKAPKKSARGKNKIIDTEATTPKLQLEIYEAFEVVGEKVPTKPEGNSSPELVRTRRANKLPSVPTIIEKTDTPQKIEISIERPTRTRGRKLRNNAENEKKAVSSDETDLKPTAKKPEESTHTDVEETKEANSHYRTKGKKRVIERSASPLENDIKRETRRRRKIDSSIEPEGAADTKEQSSRKASTRKQPVASRGKNKKVHFDQSEAQVQSTGEEPSQNGASKKRNASTVPPAELEPIKEKGSIEKKTKGKQAAHHSATLDDYSAQPRVSLVACRTRSQSKKV